VKLRRKTGHLRAARKPPHSALIGWLRQGLSMRMCPLCRVGHKADREYAWHFYDERSNDGAVVDQVSGAFGFCAEHVEMLRRIDMESMQSTLAISTMFADAFAGIAAELGQLAPDDSFHSQRCPACASRDVYLHKNAGYLLDLVATSQEDRRSFEGSPGLCFPHFELVWEQASAPAERELLLEVQRAATGSLLHDLREHVRKHNHKYCHEPAGLEYDAWQRAINLTAGWPPPPETAARPEHQAKLNPPP
jgi:hypothetical protein